MGEFELSMGKTTLAMATFCRPWANLAMAIFSRPWPKCYFFHIVITAKYIHGHYGQSNNDYNFVFNNCLTIRFFFIFPMANMFCPWPIFRPWPTCFPMGKCHFPWENMIFPCFPMGKSTSSPFFRHLQIRQADKISF